MLTLLAISAWAQASPRLVPVVPPTVTYETPFGPISGRAARGLCWSPNVRIGTVTAHKAWRKEFHDDAGEFQGDSMVTTVTFASEAVLRGPSSPATTDFVVLGDGAPLTQSSIGARYVIAWHTFDDDGGALHSSWPNGTPILNAVLTLGPPSVHSEQALKDHLASFCANTEIL